MTATRIVIIVFGAILLLYTLIRIAVAICRSVPTLSCGRSGND